MGNYASQSGRTHERQACEYLNYIGCYCVDVSTERGVGRITPDDLILWLPENKPPDPYWAEGGDGDMLEVQMKWSKTCSGFKSMYNKHDQKDSELGSFSVDPSDASHGGNTAIKWPELGVTTGSLNAFLLEHSGFPINSPGRRESPRYLECSNQGPQSFVQKATHPSTDLLIVRGPHKPFLCMWPLEDQFPEE